MKKAVAKVLGKVLVGGRRFWAIHLCAVALAVLLVLANHDAASDEFAVKVSQGIFWGALAGLFVQFLYEWRGWPWRDLGVGVTTLVIGSLGCWFWFTLVEGTPRFRFWGMFYYGTCFSLVAASVAVLYRIADVRSLVSRLTLNALGASGSAMVVTSSLMLCLLAFDKLVVPVDGRLYGDVAGVSWIILLSVGFFSFLPDSNPDDGSSDRATAFLFWLLLPAALLLLGIVSDKASGRRSAPGRMTSVTASVSGDGFLPLTGSLRIRFVNCLDVCRESKQERWRVRIPTSGDRPKESFDVTAQVESLFRGAGWDGILADESKPVIQAAEAVWELRPGLSLVFESAAFSGKTGTKVRRFRLLRCALVLKPDGEPSKAK